MERYGYGLLVDFEGAGIASRTFEANGQWEELTASINEYDWDDVGTWKIEMRRRSNLLALPPVIEPGQVRYGYRIDSDVSPDWNGYVRVGLYWQLANGTFQEIIASGGLSDTPGFQNYSYTLPTATGALAQRPANAVALATRLDVDDKVPETNEADNAATTVLPDLLIKSLKWDEHGGAIVEVRVKNVASLSSIPSSQISVSLNWSTSDTLVGRTELPLSQLLIPRKDGIYTLTLAANKVRLPNQRLRVVTNGLPEVSHLLAVVDQFGTIIERSETNNIKSIRLGRVSDELQMAPAALTGGERVRLWMRKYEKDILQLATFRDIDPRAITAIIAWEALQNIQFVKRAYGPGKVHFYGPFPDILNGVAEDIENRGFMPKLTFFTRPEFFMKHPMNSVQYVAAIVKGYTDVLRSHGYDPFTRSDGIAVLTNLYQGAGYGKRNVTEYEVWLKEQPPGYLPHPDSSMAGWTKANIQGDESGAKPGYIDSLLAGTYHPQGRKSSYPKPKTVVATVQSGGVTTINVLADFVGSQQSVTLAGATPPVSGTVTRSGDNLIYKAKEGFFGTDTFSYTVRDREGGIVGASIRVDVSSNAPSNARVSDVTETSFGLNWKDITSNENGFEVWVARAGGTPYLSERVQSDRTSAKIDFERQNGPRLSPNTAYEVKLRSYRDGGVFSAFTNPLPVTTADNRPKAPSGPRVSSVGETSFKLSWTDNASNEDGFEVWVATAGGTPLLSESVQLDRTSASVEFERQSGPRLRPNTGYEVKLRSYRDGGIFSAFTDPLAFTTADNRPKVPSALRVGSVGERSFSLSWTDNASNEDGFEVWVAKAGEAPFLSERVQADRKSTTIEFERQNGPRLTPNTAYEVKLRSYRDGGVFSTFSEGVALTTADNRPASPTRLRATSIGGQSFKLTWSDNSDNEVKFQVFIRKVGSNDWSRSEDVSANLEAATIDWLDYDARKRLARNTTYAVRMCSVRADGTVSAWSSELAVKTAN